MKTPGGLKSIAYTLNVAREVGPGKFTKSVLSKNTCKTCALGMGGQRGGMVNEAGSHLEICKKSVQAQLTDIQDAIAPHIFEQYSIAELGRMRGRELERLGRLNTPLLKTPDAGHYRPVDWGEALERIAKSMRQAEPDRTFFYSSGRSSNEAAFLLQLFVRLYGTNNVNNCSYYCHQASGVGLGAAIGTGTATIELQDLHQADCIFVIGANPSSNHPRFMTELMKCRRRGGEVIVINPVFEPGLQRFIIPSDVRSMLAGGSEIASCYLQPNIGGDIAVMKGIAKHLLARNACDMAFIAAHTNHFEAYRRDIEAESWEAIERQSGIRRSRIEHIADLYARSKNAVFSWAMGITHHRHGVENVESIVNLVLLRGMIARPGSGLLPLRGHSNVQGIGSVGVTPVLKEAIFRNIESRLGLRLPQKPGLDTMACMRAADAGEIDFAFLLGGNLYGSNPDLNYAARALDKIPFKVFLNTTLNLGHCHGVAGETVILPVAARDEEKQYTTQESMFNFVRRSDGGIVRLDNVRSEVDIISDIALAVVPDAALDFREFKNHRSIRKAIAATIPGYAALEHIDESGAEFQIAGRTLHQPVFPTPDGKANFSAIAIPEEHDPAFPLRLMTVRSEGQFNTIVYEEEDAWRGQSERWVVLMHKDDISALGLQHDGKVTLESSVGSMQNLRVREYNIARGNVLAYYPEANVLVPADCDARSKTPAFKSVKVRVKAG